MDEQVQAWWDRLSEEKREKMKAKVAAGDDLTPTDVFGTEGGHYLHAYVYWPNSDNMTVEKVLHDAVQKFVEAQLR